MITHRSDIIKTVTLNDHEDADKVEAQVFKKHNLGSDSISIEVWVKDRTTDNGIQAVQVDLYATENAVYVSLTDAEGSHHRLDMLKLPASLDSQITRALRVQATVDAGNAFRNLSDRDAFVVDNISDSIQRAINTADSPEAVMSTILMTVLFFISQITDKLMNHVLTHIDIWFRWSNRIQVGGIPMMQKIRMIARQIIQSATINSQNPKNG